MVCYHGLIVVLTHASWDASAAFFIAAVSAASYGAISIETTPNGPANIQHLEQRNHFSFLSCWGQRAGSTSNIDVDIHHGSKGVRWLRPRANLIGGTPA